MPGGARPRGALGNRGSADGTASEPAGAAARAAASVVVSLPCCSWSSARPTSSCSTRSRIVGRRCAWRRSWRRCRQPVAAAGAGVRHRSRMFARLRRESTPARGQCAAPAMAGRGAAPCRPRMHALRDLAKLVAGRSARLDIAAQVIANSGGAFARNVLVDAGAATASRAARRRDRRRADRPRRRGRRPHRAHPAPHRSQFAYPGRARDARGERARPGGRQFRPTAAALSAGPKSPVAVGDRIVTGGAGGVFPPGLPVGVVGLDRTARWCASSPMPICRGSIMSASSISASRALLPQSAVPPPRARAPRAGSPIASMMARRWRCARRCLPARCRYAWRRGIAAVRQCRRFSCVDPFGRAAAAPGLCRGDAEPSRLMAVYHWTVYRPDLLPPCARVLRRHPARSLERHALCRHLRR